MAEGELSLLARYVKCDRPDYVIRWHGVNGNTNDFSVHKIATDRAPRLKLATDHHVSDLNHESITQHQTKRRRRGSLVGETVRIVDFYVSKVPVYAELYPNDKLPFTQFLYHLYGHTGVGTKCPLEGNEHDDENDPITCGVTGWPQEFIVIWGLMKYFWCPGTMYMHLARKTIDYGIYTESSLPALIELSRLAQEDTFLLNNRFTLIKNLIALCSSLLYTVTTLPAAELHLIGNDTINPEEETIMRLQTFGDKSVFPPFRYKNTDSTEKGDLKLSLYVSDRSSQFVPYIHYINNSISDTTPWRTVLTEARVDHRTHKQDNEYHLNFSFIRDLDFVTQVIDRPGYRETLRLRDSVFCLDVAYTVGTKDERHDDQYLTVHITLTSGEVNRITSLSIEGSLLNVFLESIPMVDSFEGGDKNDCFKVTRGTKSQQWYSETTVEQDTFEFDQRETQKHQLYKHHYSMAMNLTEMRGAEDLDEYPRTFMLGGSVTFHAAKNPDI
jgi:hypothetical protein